MQGALLGVVGLLLAFGLSLAVSRYEDRRASVVGEANAIGTTYLRAQLLSEPARTASLRLLTDYAGSAIHFADYVPGSAEEDDAGARESRIQRQLWAAAAGAIHDEPVASAPRLYVETLNDMIDAQTVRKASLANRVPTAVLVLEVLGAAIALGLLSAYLAILGRGVLAVLLASMLVAFLLMVTDDLDRPTRGLIRVPDTALRNQLQSMMEPPAASSDQSPGGGATSRRRDSSSSASSASFCITGSSPLARRSCCARVTKRLVIDPVTTAKNESPPTIRSAAMTFPAVWSGTTSP